MTNKKELIDIRQKINALIIMLMDYKLQYLLSNDHIKKFSEYLVNIRKVGFHLDQESDPFTIISTNWDIIFENAIIDAIRNIDPLGGDVDYCFYVHSYNEYELGKKIRSGLYLRGQGKYNIKVLKLHGSMNWLQCQRCQRVYITYFNKIAKNEFLKKPLCRYCNENFNEAEGSYLTSALIMPTFLKDLNNFQLKLSWQIAGIELQEASKIVFMGYSFPLADFELRQLLARSVRSNAEIDVVLHQNDHPIWHHPINDYLPEHRYRSFFGKRKINFYFDGVESYIDQICG